MSHKLPSLVFLDEQTGDIEDVLKRRCIELFRIDARVRRAYLARVRLSPSDSGSVAMCLWLSHPAELLLDKVDQVFRELFKPGQKMGIIVLDAQGARDAEEACRPFFVQDDPGV